MKATEDFATQAMHPTVIRDETIPRLKTALAYYEQCEDLFSVEIYREEKGDLRYELETMEETLIHHKAKKLGMTPITMDYQIV